MTWKRMLIVLVVLLGYEIVSWFLASAIVGDSDFRMAFVCFTLAGITIAGVYVTIRTLNTKQTAGRLTEPRRSEEKHHNNEYAEAVTSSLRVANKELSRVQGVLSRGKCLLFGTPLYLLAGSAGSGKTSIFLNARIEPRLLAGKVRAEDEPSSNTAQWTFWYAAQSVFCEVPARLFTGDVGSWLDALRVLKNNGDSNSWRSKLGLRRRFHLGGVVLFCNLNEFITRERGTSPKGPDSAANLRNQLNNIVSSFGQGIPIYVVFSQCDKVDLFANYAGLLTEDEDRQVFGCTLSIRVSPGQMHGGVSVDLGTLYTLFDELYASMCDARITLMERSGDVDQNQHVFLYPKEVKRLRTTLMDFLGNMFPSDAQQPGPILRGFYFTGLRGVLGNVPATETPNRKAVLAARFGDATQMLSEQELREIVDRGHTPGPAAWGNPRWAFVGDLFNKVILRDRVPANSRFTSFHLVSAIVATLSLFLSVALIRSWSKNKTLLQDIGDVAQAEYMAPADHRTLPPIEALRSLDQLREALDKLNRYRRQIIVAGSHWGLYSGDEVLPDVTRLYFKRFREMLLGDILVSLDRKLTGLSASARALGKDEGVYDNLKAYLMLTSGGCKPNKSFLSPFLFRALQSTHSLDPGTEKGVVIQRQLDFFAGELQRRTIYDDLQPSTAAISGAREFLARYPAIDSLYREALQDVEKQVSLPAKLSSIAPKYQVVLTGPPEVEAAFTLEGRPIALQSMKSRILPNHETCVLGDGNTLTDLRANAGISGQLIDRYTNDYIRRWKEFLGNYTVVRAHDPADDAEKLRILADNQSPLLALLYMTGYNTDISSGSPIAGPQVGDAIGSKIPGLNRIFGSRAKQAQEAGKLVNALSTRPNTSASDIAHVFQPVRVVVDPKKPTQYVDKPNEEYMNALGKLQQAMSRIASSGSAVVDPSIHAEARRAADGARDAITHLARAFQIGDTVDPEVKKLLLAPIVDAERFIKEPSTLARDKLNGAARQFCSGIATLRSKYPFDPSGATEVSLRDLAEIFAPQTGALWNFQKQNLDNIIVPRGTQWVQTSGPSEVQVTDAFLRSFNRMARISRVLFPPGAGEPLLAYTLKLTPNQSVEGLTLAIDGEKLVVRGGQGQQRFSWPGSQPGQGATLQIAGSITQLQWKGVWGVFKMMQDADHPPATNIFEISKFRHGQIVDTAGNPLSIQLQVQDSGEVSNVFSRDFFAGLQCPPVAAR